MFLLLLAFVGGILTIVSPCILPVLPFVFSRADQPFRRSGLPLLAGMALTFAVMASLAAAAGTWIVRANQVGRYVALVIFAVLGISLLSPAFAEYLSRPFVRLGGRVQSPGSRAPSVGRSVLLGVSTGLLWAPCAGPILGLILTTAAVEGASVGSLLLLTSFAAGAACSLAVVLLAGNRVFAAMKRSLGAEEWIRRGLGVAVLLGALAIALGWDTGILARVSLASTSGIEQDLVNRVKPPAQTPDVPAGPTMSMSASNVSRDPALSMKGAAPAEPALDLPNEGMFPSLDGAIGWLNSAPLTREALAGKVVVVDFWTYSCINCLRSIPYVEAWSEKYRAAGLIVIGVHTPEFAFEKEPSNVSKAVKSLGITYPVAIDSNYAIWKAFRNQYWPAHYFIDSKGTIRYHHFGEGEYDKSEEVIQQLLKEKNSNLEVSGLVNVKASGAQAAPDLNDVESPETYIGYERQQNYVSREKIQPDSPGNYTAPGRLDVNNWGLAGQWNVGAEKAILVSAPGKIVFRFHARDLHLVLGPGKDGKPIRFRVMLDGTAPMDDKGADVDSNGNGTVTEYRLYQLIRQKGKVEDRTFEIEFLDPGVQAFAFTFG
jgi:cytochrome c biogenesis protein CcdA/thiol-disulfide isomerase/thioredoxin